jgi:hypothetical protein
MSLNAMDKRSYGHAAAICLSEDVTLSSLRPVRRATCSVIKSRIAETKSQIAYGER